MNKKIVLGMFATMALLLPFSALAGSFILDITWTGYAMLEGVYNDFSQTNILVQTNEMKNYGWEGYYWLGNNTLIESDIGQAIPSEVKPFFSLTNATNTSIEGMINESDCFGDHEKVKVWIKTGEEPGQNIRTLESGIWSVDLCGSGCNGNENFYLIYQFENPGSAETFHVKKAVSLRVVE